MVADKKRKINRKLAIITGSTLILFVAIFFFVYDVFMNHPAIQYAEAERNTFDTIHNITREYNQIDEWMKEQSLNTRSKTNAKISADFSIHNNDTNELDSTIMLIQNFLPMTELRIDTYQDPEYLESLFDVKLFVQGINLLEGTVYQDKELTAVQFPIFSKDSIGMNNNDVDQVFGETALIEKIPNIIELQNRSISPFEFFQIYREYFSFINQELANATMEVVENAKYKERDFTKYTVHIEEEVVKEIIRKVLDKIADDERILPLIESPFLHSQDNLFEEVTQKLDEVQFPEGLTYTAYYNEKYVAHRNLYGLVTVGEDIIDIDFSFDTIITHNHSFEISMDLRIDSTLEDTYFFVKFDTKGEPQGNSFYRINRMLSFGYEDIADSGSIHFNFRTVYKDDISDTVYQIYADLNEPIVPTISGSIIHEKTPFENSVEQSTKFTIGMDYVNEVSQLLESYYAVFNIEENIQYGLEREDIPTFNKDQVIILSEKDTEERLQLLEEIKRASSSHYIELIQKLIPF